MLILIEDQTCLSLSGDSFAQGLQATACPGPIFGSLPAALTPSTAGGALMLTAHGHRQAAFKSRQHLLSARVPSARLYAPQTQTPKQSNHASVVIFSVACALSVRYPYCRSSRCKQSLPTSANQRPSLPCSSPRNAPESRTPSLVSTPSWVPQLRGSAGRRWACR